jgi:hypothetical protein
VREKHIENRHQRLAGKKPSFGQRSDFRQAHQA